MENETATQSKTANGLVCDSKFFNRNFIIRYYPESEKLGNHKLIGFSTLVTIVGQRTINQLLERVINSADNIQEVKLRRGIMFRFIAR